MLRIKGLLAGSILVLACISAQGQNDRIQIIVNTAPGETPPTWVAISGLSGEAEEVLRFDLYVQGFNFTNADRAQYVITASADGNFQGRVVDNISKNQIVAKAYSGAALRRQVHAFADDFVNAINRIGIAQTKIAFKTDSGMNSEIRVADFDGFNPQEVTRDNSIVAAPAWVPGQFALYYTSYRLGNPNIFYHNLATGERRVFAKYPGLNSSAAVSPNNGAVAMILSKGGSPDVYVCDADGGNLVRLTKTPQDESSPCWSPDGQTICFAGKISERRSLCRVPASGGSVTRIPTVGVSNPTEPAWSPDGKWIAFTRQARDFEICVVPAAGGDATILVTGEDPSWAPNSRTLVFTRRQGDRRVLSLLDVFTKQVKDVTRISGSNSQPSWAR